MTTRDEYKAALWRMMKEASTHEQRDALMKELIITITVMLVSVCVSYRGDEGDLLDGIAAVCSDIRASATDKYVAIRRVMRGQKT